MANGMAFSEMQLALSDNVTSFDTNVSPDLTKIKRWLNISQREIAGRKNWPFLVGHEIIQTVPDLTTGTISINSGSTSLTFSSAPAVTVADRFVQFSDEGDWYRIVTHTAAATAATITPSYGGSSNLVGATYKVRKIFYSTTTPFDSILDMKNTNGGKIISSAIPRETDVLFPLYYDAGSVYQYINSVPDSSGNMRFSFLYSPSSAENIQVRGIKTIVDMSADSDQSIIPGRWCSIILDLASYHAFSSLNDSRAANAYTKAENGIEAMRRIYDTDLGRHRVTRSLTESVSDGPNAMLPPEYGVVDL